TCLVLHSMRFAPEFAWSTRNLTSFPTFRLPRTFCLKSFQADLEFCSTGERLSVGRRNSLRRSVLISTLERVSNASALHNDNSSRSPRPFRLQAGCWSWMNQPRRSHRGKWRDYLRLSALPGPLA